MNTTSTPPSSDSPASSQASSESRPYTFTQPYSGGLKKRQTLLFVLILLLVAAIAGLSWMFRGELDSLRTEMARRLQTGETGNATTQASLKSVQEMLKEVQAKVAVLDSRQAEAQSQQLALEQLYQDLSKNRDDWVLSEIEQVLSTAAQQLQLAANVPGALIALQNADRNLSASDKPQFILIRRALANDIERLKAVPAIDLTGMALRLDSAIGQIDSMPLLSDEKPIQSPAPSTKPVVAESMVASPDGALARLPFIKPEWIASMNNHWQSLVTEMNAEMRQLLRVRSVDTPDALLLAPSQSYYVRENLKLRLLNARLGLLSRNESAFRNDMIAAQEIIARYFDTRAKQTQTVQALLKQVQNNRLSIELPTLSESLNAVRDYKTRQ